MEWNENSSAAAAGSPVSGSHGSPSLLADSRLAPQPDDKRSSWQKAAEKLAERGGMSPAVDARGPRWPDSASAAEKSCFTVRWCGEIRPSRDRKTPNLLPTLPLLAAVFASLFTGRNVEKHAFIRGNGIWVRLFDEQFVFEWYLSGFIQPSWAF